MDRVHGCGAVGNELLGSAAEPKGTKHSCNEPEPLGVFCDGSFALSALLLLHQSSGRGGGGQVLEMNFSPDVYSSCRKAELQIGICFVRGNPSPGTALLLAW